MQMSEIRTRVAGWEEPRHPGSAMHDHARVPLYPTSSHNATKIPRCLPLNPPAGPISPEARDLKRFFFNYSHDTELDSAHRVMIPPSLMEYAGLDREVVVTGSGECLEVFDRAKYSGYSEDVLTRVPDIAAKLGHTA